MVKLQYDGKKRFHITVPAQIVRLCGWKKGTELIFMAQDEKTILLKEMPKRK